MRGLPFHTDCAESLPSEIQPCGPLLKNICARTYKILRLISRTTNRTQIPVVMKILFCPGSPHS